MSVFFTLESVKLDFFVKGYFVVAIAQLVIQLALEYAAILISWGLWWEKITLFLL